MAGWIKLTPSGPIAWYTPDGRSLVLQEGMKVVKLDEPGLKVFQRVGNGHRALFVRSRSTKTTIRVRDSLASEAQLAPLDDGWILNLHRLATNLESRNIVLANWDTAAVPEGFHIT
jgi:hypothetical protein